ncbi:(deoxy)nucleoside triphosphate pyrophosphohydrolase [Microbacterium sp. SS28]|uniref:(deoxy)nucleoside triphosphate pyrophosphohydrolase n=1 Tax=Microbacterium sp. SS28 TaxID=2919948 RepID=UPI001FAACB7E|nr:(deoxy)nucleoside triphosphate pyrophosphohydrolase [Microbacterium sp. SS28]
MRKQINVVGAVIVRDGTVLCAKRGPLGSLAGRWEFPGGKIEPGETARAALEREIAEELECAVDVGDEVTKTAYEYDFGVVTLTTFWCELLEGSPRLTEHAEVRWCLPGELEELDWAPADIPAARMVFAAAGSGQLGQS